MATKRTGRQERAARNPNATGPAGTVLRAVGKDGPQRITTCGHRWSDEAEAKFLDELGASCNVTRAAAAAGFTPVAIHRRRRNDPAFSQRWHAALVQGYHRLEALLVQRAVEAMDGYEPDPETPIPTMTVRDAISILQMYRATVTGGEGKRAGWRARPRSLEEVQASILQKFEAIEAKRLARDDAA